MSKPTDKEVVAAIRAAGELLKDRNKRTTHKYAVTEQGTPVFGGHASAVCFCLVGAVQKTCGVKCDSEDRENCAGLLYAGAMFQMNRRYDYNSTEVWDSASPDEQDRIAETLASWPEIVK
jgi:hypothetical protein